MKSLLCLLLLVTVSLGKKPPTARGKWPDPENDNYYKLVRKARGGDDTISQHELDRDKLVQNVAVVPGSTVILRCAVQPPSMSHSIQWMEYATSSAGIPISDNDVIGFHPNRDRYEIVGDDQFEYSLKISPVLMEDGGGYRCFDAQSLDINEKQTHAAGLVVLSASPNCTTTIGESSVVILDSYQTNDCIRDYQGPIVPQMEWSGVGVFEQRQVATDSTIWSGMQYNVSMDMDTRAHQCTTFFIDNFSPLPDNQADNVPTYTHVHSSRQHYVYWGPRNHSITPVKPTYEVGEMLTCVVTAFPPATFIWQNLRTGVIFTGGNTWRVDESWLGFNQSIRCEATNVIEGTNYVNNVFLAVDVPLPTTTFPPTTPTTTTQPPAVSPCRDLSGNWVSTSPTDGTLCIRLDLANLGHLSGLLKNGTESFWIDLHGRAQADKFDQVGFNGIWPLDIGVSSFVGECHRCMGMEEILINVVSRSKGSPCGASGDIRYTTQYRFRRSPVLTCPGYPASPVY